MTRHCPFDVAVGKFRCALDPSRLLSTPTDELELALSVSPRGANAALSTVYVMGNEANSLVKIGYADNLKHRFSGLNNGSPVQLEIVHFVHVVDGVVAKLVESRAHQMLVQHRRRGEWFDVNVELAAEAIGKSVKSINARWWTEQERRRLVGFARKTAARHAQHERIFGA